MPRFSLITCFFNSARRLPDYFAALRRLRVSEGEVEFLFVDNASTDDTATQLKALSQGLAGTVQILHDPRSGLMHARCCGVAAAKGEFVLFLDDDTEPEPDYLEQLRRLIDEHPAAVCITGNCVLPPGYEAPLRGADALAILTIRRLSGEFSYRLDGFYPPAFPWGAGLFARAQALRAACSAWAAGSSGILGRTGTSLSGGEDIWLVHWLARDSAPIVFSEKLVLVHRFDRARLAPAHLARLARENGEQEASIIEAIAALKPGLGLRTPSSYRTLLVRLPYRLIRFWLTPDGNSLVAANRALGAAAQAVSRRLRESE